MRDAGPPIWSVVRGARAVCEREVTADDASWHPIVARRSEFDEI
jgi:hypothetical protein